MDENQVLELVEFYEDMIEKQDEIIVRRSGSSRAWQPNFLICEIC